MSGDFSFPSLGAPRTQQAPAAAPAAPAAPASPSGSSSTNPFALQQPAAAAPPQQQQQQPQQQVQLQQPVRPHQQQQQQQQQTEPLTARSTVVHATTSSSSRAPTSQQQQQQQHVAPPRPKPVPITQVQAEGRRNKVPLEKGFSQVSWMKLTKSGQDLTGGHGRRRDITLEEVQQHRTADDAWMVLHGKVYNITPYLPFHPGGADVLMKAAGRDGTALFNKYHPWVNAAALLEKCLVGLLHKPAGEGSEQQPSSTLKSKLAQMFK